MLLCGYIRSIPIYCINGMIILIKSILTIVTIETEFKEKVKFTQNFSQILPFDFDDISAARMTRIRMSANHVTLDTITIIAVLLVGPLLAVSEENCSCGVSKYYDWIGPHCARWIPEEPPFCILDNGPIASTCPGAVQWGNESLYWTEDPDICKISNPSRPKILSLTVRQPFTVKEITEICFYALNILIGTCGNAFVVKHFAFGDPSTRPGSRFVIFQQ